MADYTNDEVEEVFDEAVTLITSSKIEISDKDKLLLYGYYKQANEGKCNTQRPGMFDFTGKAKWDAWNAVGDISNVEAMKRYCEIIHRLVPSWDPWKARALDKSAKKASMAPVVSRPQVDEEEEATTICDFAATGDIEKVKQKIESGVDVDWRDEEGRTALHMAADRNNIPLCQLLLSKKANINAKDNEGSTPLHYACICEYEKMIKFLLENGADKTIACDSGETPNDFFDMTNLN